MTLATRALTLRLAAGDAAPDGRTIPVIASTSAVDSYDEVIDQASWRLDRFAKAPTALLQHLEYDAPIGYYRDVRVEGDALRATLVLYEGKADPKGYAEEILARYRQGGPVSVSVGFRVGRSESEDRAGKKVRTLYDCELHEISVVSIGANPDAVATRAARRRKEHTTMSIEEYFAANPAVLTALAAACGKPEADVVAALSTAKAADPAVEAPAAAVEEAKALRSSVEGLSAEMAKANARALAAEARADKVERSAEIDAMKASRQWIPTLDPFLSTLSTVQLRAYRASAPALVPASAVDAPREAPDSAGQIPADVAALVAKGWPTLSSAEKHVIMSHSAALAERIRKA